MILPSNPTLYRHFNIKSTYLPSNSSLEKISFATGHVIATTTLSVPSLRLNIGDFNSFARYLNALCCPPSFLDNFRKYKEFPMNGINHFGPIKKMEKNHKFLNFILTNLNF